LERSETQTVSYSKSENYVKNVSFNIEGSIGAKVNSFGTVYKSNISVNHNLGISSGSGREESVTWGYVLEDENTDDYYSINIYGRTNKGIYDVEEATGYSSPNLPSGFEWGMLGGGVVGGGMAIFIAIKMANAFRNQQTGAIGLGVTTAAAAIGAGLAYIPYETFKRSVKDDISSLENEKFEITSFDLSSPVFSIMGGSTQCPFEGNEFAFFHFEEDGDDIKHVQLNKATLQSEVPLISVDDSLQLDIPTTDRALFTIRLKNESESKIDQWYKLSIDQASNPYGAIIKIDGTNPDRTVLIPAGATVIKTVSVEMGNPSILKYEDMGIILHSQCQDEIADTVFIAAIFQPSCMKAGIIEPHDNWLVNKRSDNKLPVKIGNFNINYDNFKYLAFEHKTSFGDEKSWVVDEYFINDTLLLKNDTFKDAKIIESNEVEYSWDVIALQDREYDIRVKSVCTDGSVYYTDILSGTIDRSPPQVFGTPEPGNGILDAGEDISVRFNEAILQGAINKSNFEVKATLGKAPVKHDVFLNFDGISNYSSVEVLNLNNKSISVEAWVNWGDVLKNSVLFSYGNSADSKIEAGFKNNKIYFNYGSKSVTAEIATTGAVPFNAWHHLGFVVEYNGDDSSRVYILQNDEIISETFSVLEVLSEETNNLFIGKPNDREGEFFRGNIHEFRIWVKAISDGDFYAGQYQTLSGNERGLYGYWYMNEAGELISKDRAASRNMNVSNAQWSSTTSGYSWNFGESSYLSLNSTTIPVEKDMDYTLEFWFKKDVNTIGSSDSCSILSIGQDSAYSDEKSMNIFATAASDIFIQSKGSILKMVDKNYLDGNWHHFALVLKRSGNVKAIVDGQLQREIENSVLGGLAGPKLFLGARVRKFADWQADNYFNGKIDEFRLWNKAKTLDQIRLEYNSMLEGNEMGLLAYIPFDTLSVLYPGSKETNLKDYAFDNNIINEEAGDFDSDAPLIKDVRPLQKINFDFVANEDGIVITPKSYLLPQLEKSTVEITVEGIYDQNGNPMASPATWVAYVHQNQLRWEDLEIRRTNMLYDTTILYTSIKNSGGKKVEFIIDNIPPWLTVTPSSGEINPESSLPVKLKLHRALNIGHYLEELSLRQVENDFVDKLSLNIKIFRQPPDWQVNPADYKSSMSIIGQIMIDNVLSSDEFDRVGAFKNDKCRGVVKLKYNSDLDAYMAFLNIYGNDAEQDDGIPIEFRLWDASVGHVLDDVIPNDILFRVNEVIGNTIEPILFKASDIYQQSIPVAKGWNWVSFNKLSVKQDNLNLFLESLNPQEGDQLKMQLGSFSQYSDKLGWDETGGIDSIDNISMYQLKISKDDTLVYSGRMIKPEDNLIPLAKDWNSIGYLPDLAMDVNDALRFYEADTSEIIKSQYEFSMYDPRTGWLGTLEVMQPGMGYMLNIKAQADLKYPSTTVFKSTKIPRITSPPLGWNKDLSSYSDNLSIVAKLDVVQSNLIINNQMVLGAFINKMCHGFVAPLTKSNIGYEPFFLNVNNNINGQWIEFTLYDGVTGKTYQINEKRPFVKDAVYGTIQYPMLLTLKGISTGGEEMENKTWLKCYPNPFSGRINIEFSGTNENVAINVLTPNGSLVKQIYDSYPVSGTNKAVWDGRNEKGSLVASGMYYIRFISGDVVKIVKISKTR